MEQMQIIPWYQSNTLRGLIVSLVALVLATSGVTDEVTASTNAAQVADAILLLISLGGQIWAMYARTMKANPPITQTSQDKAIAMVVSQQGETK